MRRMTTPPHIRLMDTSPTLPTWNLQQVIKQKLELLKCSVFLRKITAVRENAERHSRQKIPNRVQRNPVSSYVTCRTKVSSGGCRWQPGTLPTMELSTREGIPHYEHSVWGSSILGLFLCSGSSEKLDLLKCSVF